MLAIGEATTDVTELGPIVTQKCSVKVTPKSQGSAFIYAYANGVQVSKIAVQVTGRYSKSISGASIDGVSATYEYTGGEVKPEVTVKLDGKTLSEGADYTVAYSNNTGAGTASVIVTGMGNYSGSVATSFTISPASISGADVVVDAQEWSGSAATPAPTVTWNGKVLVVGTDYTVGYSDNTGAGTATVTVAGKGNFSGSKSASFTIAPASIEGADVSVDDQEWTGGALTPAPIVTLNGATLAAGSDYSVSYADNTDAGTATVTVAGKGNYTGTAMGTFAITKSGSDEPTKTSVEGASMSVPGGYVYTGSKVEPDVVVTLDGKALSAGTDYSVSYKNNLNAGTASVTVVGKGDYTGSVTGSFSISAADASDAEVEVADQEWTGKSLEPAPTVTLAGRKLVSGTDYIVSYKNNVNVGTAVVMVRFRGNYTGTVAATFAITKSGSDEPTKTSIEGASVSVPSGYAYIGSEIKPSVKVTLDGKVLNKGGDYTVSYKDNVNAGTATVVVTGTGAFTGTVTTKFDIAAADASDAKVEVADQEQTGKALEPAPTVTLDGKKLAKGTDFNVAYKDNVNVGTATVTVTFKGNYSGTAKGTFKISKKDSGSTTSTVTMYRLYNPYTGEHLYTSSEAEIENLKNAGWNNEGYAWTVPSSGTEVHRLYNPYAPGGDHHYTTNTAEVEMLKAAGWSYEGVAWYSADEKTGVKVYRAYNPYATTGTHHYTINASEIKSLEAAGWKAEGVGWFGVK